MTRFLAGAALIAILSGPAAAGGDDLTHEEKLAISARLVDMGCVIGDIEDVERYHDGDYHHGHHVLDRKSYHGYDKGPRTSYVGRHGEVYAKSTKDGGTYHHGHHHGIGHGGYAHAGIVYLVEGAVCPDGHDYDIKFDGRLRVIKMVRD